MQWTYYPNFMMQVFFFKSEHSFLGVLEGLKLWLQLPFLKVNDIDSRSRRKETLF